MTTFDEPMISAVAVELAYRDALESLSMAPPRADITDLIAGAVEYMTELLGYQYGHAFSPAVVLTNAVAWFAEHDHETLAAPERIFSTDDYKGLPWLVWALHRVDTGESIDAWDPLSRRTWMGFRMLDRKQMEHQMGEFCAALGSPSLGLVRSIRIRSLVNLAQCRLMLEAGRAQRRLCVS